jgi:hypothetical protein
LTSTASPTPAFAVVTVVLRLSRSSWKFGDGGPG